MEKENIMPIVLGAKDKSFLKLFRKKYGNPTIVLDTKIPFRLRISPLFYPIKMTSAQDEIVIMYIASLLEGTDRIPLLAANEEYRAFVERNRDKLSPICILWHENFEF